MRTLVFVVGLMLSSCASTSATSLREPQYRGVQRFNQVAVHAEVADLALRKRVEEEFVNHLNASRIRAVASLHFFVERPSADRERDLLAQAGSDALLTVRVDFAGVTTREVDAGSRTKTTTHEACTEDGKCRATEEVTYVSPTVVSTPHLRVSAHLEETVSGHTAWHSQLRSDGDAFASLETTIAGTASKLTEELVATGFFH